MKMKLHVLTPTYNLLTKFLNIVLLTLLISVAALVLHVVVAMWGHAELPEVALALAFLTSGLSVILALGFGIVRIITKKKVDVNLSEFKLTVNSGRPLNRISEYGQIQYRGNYLTGLGTSYEVDNRTTFKVIQSRQVSEMNQQCSEFGILKSSPRKILSFFEGFVGI